MPPPWADRPDPTDPPRELAYGSMLDSFHERVWVGRRFRIGIELQKNDHVSGQLPNFRLDAFGVLGADKRLPYEFVFGVTDPKRGAIVKAWGAGAAALVEGTHLFALRAKVGDATDIAFAATDDEPLATVLELGSGASDIANAGIYIVDAGGGSREKAAVVRIRYRQ